MVVRFAFVMNSLLGEFEWTPSMDAYWMTGKSFGIHDVIFAQPFAKSRIDLCDVIKFAFTKNALVR